MKQAHIDSVEPDNNTSQTNPNTRPYILYLLM